MGRRDAVRYAALPPRPVIRDSRLPLDHEPTYAHFEYAHFEYAHLEYRTLMEPHMTDTVRADGGGQGGEKALKRIEFLILAVLQTGPLHG